MNKTGIAWTDFTWNPVIGCSRVSPGCEQCWAEHLVATRLAKNPKLPVYRDLARVRENGEPQWLGTTRFLPERLEEPLKRRKPARIFVCDMSDLFHDSVTDEQLDRVFAVVAACASFDRGVIFQVLTKRANRMRRYFTDPGLRARIATRAAQRCEDGDNAHDWLLYGESWPLPNLWLGVTVEDQQRADERIPELLATPAAVRFLSCEPLLEPVDIRRWTALGIECSQCEWRGSEADATERHFEDAGPDDEEFACPSCGAPCGHRPINERLDWTIIGGESGPRARPFDLAWARSIVAQCRAAGVAPFVKQLGSNAIYSPTDGAREESSAPWPTKDNAGADPAEWPADLRVREFPTVTP